MEVVVFGKHNCGKCAGTKERVTVLIEKMGLSATVPMRFVNLDTVDGLAEGAFYDVYDAVPVTIIRDEAEDVLSRWEGVMPRSEELKPFLENVNRAPAS
jgi:hypothetical protein